MLSVDPDNLHKKGKADDLSFAKGLICYLGYYQLGINGKELAVISVYNGLQSRRPTG
jgi:hypothetical protein